MSETDAREALREGAAIGGLFGAGMGARFDQYPYGFGISKAAVTV